MKKQQRRSNRDIEQKPSDTLLLLLEWIFREHFTPSIQLEVKLLKTKEILWIYKVKRGQRPLPFRILT